MDNATILPGSIAASEHLSALDRLAGDRFAGLDLTPLLVYMIDTTSAEALRFLADQFDVLGFKGWFLTTSDAERRELIKKAIELHRYKGTPFAIKEALKSIGFFDAEIIEGVPAKYNGFIQYNGATKYGALNWAHFKIKLDLGNYKGISEEQTSTLRALVNEYKNARSLLVDVEFASTTIEEIQPEESLQIVATFDAIEETVPASATYNGARKFDGSFTYGGDGEVFKLKIKTAFEDSQSASETFNLTLYDKSGAVI